MSQIMPYLVFTGNCREAMEFYAKCLGGEITTMQTFGDSPIEVPEDHQHSIFNSEVKAGNIRIKASDDLPSHPTLVGNNVSIYILYNNKQSQRDVFDKLSAGGHVLFPIEGSFGMLRDRYGIQWMIVDGSAEG